MKNLCQNYVASWKNWESLFSYRKFWLSLLIWIPTVKKFFNVDVLSQAFYIEKLSYSWYPLWKTVWKRHTRTSPACDAELLSIFPNRKVRNMKMEQKMTQCLPVHNMSIDWCHTGVWQCFSKCGPISLLVSQSSSYWETFSQCHWLPERWF